MMHSYSFHIQDEPVDVEALLRMLDDPGTGARVSFDGRVRDHHEGRAVLKLFYEAYAPLALRSGERILREAVQRFAIHRVVCVHRLGELRIGECAVWIGVGAAHRDAAFDACRFTIDRIKADVPIWKREHYADGTAVWSQCPQCAAAGAPHAKGHDSQCKH
jgi:molybdopterin synthase catalytic subunit